MRSLTFKLNEIRNRFVHSCMYTNKRLKGTMAPQKQYFSCMWKLSNIPKNYHKLNAILAIYYFKLMASLVALTKLLMFTLFSAN